MKTAKFGLITSSLLGFVFGLSSALGAEALTSWVDFPTGNVFSVTAQIMLNALL